MSRPNRIWYRKDVGWWMVTIGGRKVRLAQGRQHKRAAEQKFHELMLVTPEAPESASARVADVIEAFLAWAKIHLSSESNRNYIWYGQAFSEHSGFVNVVNLKPFHVTQWVDEKGWAGTTERNARRSVHRAFSWAMQQGLIAKNPLHGMKSPRAAVRSRIMSDAEFRTVLRAADTDFKQFLFALQQTGARPKEIRTLKWQSVMGERWVLAQHKTVGKTNRPRVIYLTAPMQKLMRVLRTNGADEASPVFRNRVGVAWTSSAVQQRLQRLRKKTNLPKDLCLYLLRHAFGTNAVLNGVDVATVAELMGHTSLDMVSKVYLHLAAERSHLVKAAEQATSRRATPMPPPTAASPGA